MDSFNYHMRGLQIVRQGLRSAVTEPAKAECLYCKHSIPAYKKYCDVGCAYNHAQEIDEAEATGN